jgi:hypothetical protein
MVSCPIFPSILIAKYLFTGSLKNRSIDNLEIFEGTIRGHTFYFVRNCIRWGYYLLFWMNCVADLLWRSFYLCRSSIGSFVERDFFINCTWNLSLKFIEVRIICYLMPVIGKNMISWFYAYVEHIEIKTKTVNIIQYAVIKLYYLWVTSWRPHRNYRLLKMKSVCVEIKKNMNLQVGVYSLNVFLSTEILKILKFFEIFQVLKFVVQWKKGSKVSSIVCRAIVSWRLLTRQ